MSNLKLPNYSAASLRVYVPELVPLVEPGGRIVEYLVRCFDSNLTAPDGTEIPCGYYFTNCNEPVVHNYSVRGITWDSYGNDPDDCCEPITETEGINPCNPEGTCFDPSCPDPTQWWEFLPDPLPEMPIILVGEDNELAVNDTDSLWWY